MKHAHVVETVGRFLSTIDSPAFSELVVVFSEVYARRPPRGLGQVLRGLYRIKSFRLAFCLETLEEFVEPALRQLTLETKAAVASGMYDFLPCPPLVFARTETRYDRRFLEDL